MVPDDPQEITTPRRAALPRRLRFEILRRDGHSCRYCGAKAPDVALTVDHVIPVALGGSDEASNLVTACADCNAGKSSSQPDAALVEDVAADALRWKAAIEQAQMNMHAERQVLDGLLDRFYAEWTSWTYQYEVEVPAEPFPATGNELIDEWHRTHLRWDARPVALTEGVLTIQVKKGHLTEVRRVLRTKAALTELSSIYGTVESVVIVDGYDDIDIPYPNRPTKRLETAHREPPADWRESVERFVSNGLSEDDLLRYVRITMETPYVRNLFGYFCSRCWNRISDIQEDARRIIESQGD